MTAQGRAPATRYWREDTSVASGRKMEQIAAGKGPRPKPFMLATKKAAPADAVWQSKPRESTITRRAKALQAAPSPDRLAKRVKLPDFVSPQLCRSVDRPPSDSGWVHEIKFDGYRTELRVEGGKARLLTRSGLDWTKRFPAIARAAHVLPDCLIDGEVVALNNAGTPDFAALQAALSEGDGGDLIYFAFDLLHADGEDLRNLPLAERKQRLAKLLGRAKLAGKSTIRYVEHIEGSGEAVMESARRMNLEGIVSKRLDAGYVSGRGDGWVKAKCRPGHEVVIGGWSGDGEHLRSLLVGVHRGKQLVYLGRVGTGFGKSSHQGIAGEAEGRQPARPIPSAARMRPGPRPMSTG